MTPEDRAEITRLYVAQGGDPAWLDKLWEFTSDDRDAELIRDRVAALGMAAGQYLVAMAAICTRDGMPQEAIVNLMQAIHQIYKVNTYSVFDAIEALDHQIDHPMLRTQRKRSGLDPNDVHPKPGTAAQPKVATPEPNWWAKAFGTPE